VAQVKEVISGWAAEVIGDMVERLGGSVVLLGKRTGETYKLFFCVSFSSEGLVELHTDSVAWPFRPISRRQQEEWAMVGLMGNP